MDAQKVQLMRVTPTGDSLLGNVQALG